MSIRARAARKSAGAASRQGYRVDSGLLCTVLERLVASTVGVRCALAELGEPSRQCAPLVRAPESPGPGPRTRRDSGCYVVIPPPNCGMGVSPSPRLSRSFVGVWATSPGASPVLAVSPRVARPAVFSRSEGSPWAPRVLLQSPHPPPPRPPLFPAAGEEKRGREKSEELARLREEVARYKGQLQEMSREVGELRPLRDAAEKQQREIRRLSVKLSPEELPPGPQASLQTPSPAACTIALAPRTMTNRAQSTPGSAVHSGRVLLSRPAGPLGGLRAAPVEVRQLQQRVLSSPQYQRDLARTKSHMAKWLKKMPHPPELISQGVLLSLPFSEDPGLPRCWSGVLESEAGKASGCSMAASSSASTATARTPPTPLLSGDRSPTSVARGRHGSNFVLSRTPIIDTKCSQHFKIEVGVSGPLGKLPITLDDVAYDKPYADHMANTHHYNFVGQGKGGESVIVSAAAEPEHGSYRVIVRTQDENYRTMMIDAAWVHGGTKPRHLIRTVQMLEKAFANLTFTLVPRSSTLEADLLAYESALLVRNAKIGILYAIDGQTTEEQMFANRAPSQAFLDFLDLMGTRIKLCGWTRFRGDLDVQGGTSGEESYFTEWRGLEIMFHVSTLLPYSEGDSGQVLRKSKIGNDMVVVVFKEGSTPFDATSVRSQFIQVFPVVRPLEGGGYHLAVASKRHLSPYGPFLPCPAVFPDPAQFREFLLTKVLNAEQSAMHADAFASRMQSVRSHHLCAIAKKHRAPSTSSLLRK